MADSPTKDNRLSRLSVTSSHYDIGKKGFLNDEEKQVRAMDINGEGAVSAEFAITLIKQNSALDAEIQKLQKRQLIMYVIVLACCVATMISSIVGAEQAKDTMINDQGNLVSKFNGAPIETSEALEDTGSTGFVDMTNDELADLKYISSDENIAHLAVKGHVRNGDSSVTLLVEGGTVTFNNDGYFNSTGETGTLLKVALGDFFIEDTYGNRRDHRRGNRRLSEDDDAEGLEFFPIDSHYDPFIGWTSP